MLEYIKNLLDSNKNISDYSINECKVQSKELFFIKDKLDINREANYTESTVKVYVDFVENDIQYKGDSSVVISASDTEEEIENKILSAVESAKYVKNKYYELPKENKQLNVNNKYTIISDFKEKYKDIYDIIYAKYEDNVNLNSCELFVVETNIHYVNSSGVDCSYNKNKFMYEIVTDSSSEKEDVEIFNDYNDTSIDLEKLRENIKNQCIQTKGRVIANRNKEINNIRLVLSGKTVEELLYFYVSQASAGDIYNGTSRAKVGESFLAKSAKQKLNISIDPMLENSIFAAPVDSEGKIGEKYTLYKDGVVENIVGNAKYCHYLNLNNNGGFTSFEVLGGEKELREYLKTDYVEVLTFSSFLLDTDTGDFGGEFRLAKYVKDNETHYISGGALSLNIFELQNAMLFSKELQKSETSICPKAIIFDGVNISGDK